MTIEDKAQGIIAGLYIPTSEDRAELVQRIVDVLTDSGQQLQEARAAEAYLLLRYRSLEKILFRVDRELTDGTHGPHEIICKIAEAMEVFAQTPSISGNPGAPLLAELKLLRELAEKVEGFKVHGVAKDGTHHTLMVNALAAYRAIGGGNDALRKMS